MPNPQECFSEYLLIHPEIQIQRKKNVAKLVFKGEGEPITAILEVCFSNEEIFSRG